MFAEPGRPALDLFAVQFVDSVASPQSNMAFCVHSAVFLL